MMRTDGMTEHDTDAIAEAIDAENAFENIMEQTARTTFRDDLHVRLALSSLIGAWGCVTRARAAASKSSS